MPTYIRDCQEVRMHSRPVGDATIQDFGIVVTEVPPRAPGQVLIRSAWLFVDPYARGWMDDTQSCVPLFTPSAALEGGAIGEVVASESAAIPVGATVSRFAGWRSGTVLDTAAVTPIDTAPDRPEDYLGVLGAMGPNTDKPLVGLLEEGCAL